MFPLTICHFMCRVLNNQLISYRAQWTLVRFFYFLKYEEFSNFHLRKFVIWTIEYSLQTHAGSLKLVLSAEYSLFFFFQ